MCDNALSTVFGENTNFTCVAKKALRWMWRFNGGPLPNNANPHDTASSATSSSQLVVYEAGHQNSGTYSCEGYDDHQRLVEARTFNLTIEDEVEDGKHFIVNSSTESDCLGVISNLN